MRLILYAPPLNTAGQRLLQIVRSLGAEKRHEFYATIKKLDARLRRPMGSASVAVLCPANNDDLAALIAIRHLLRDLRVILVLPDGQAQTISDGHALRPRFVSYADGDFSDVAAVVVKMACNEAQAMASAH